MKPRTFAVGQRVAVYGPDDSNQWFKGERGTVERADTDDVAVDWDDKDTINSSVHPRQCVPLKPRKKREPRRVWLNDEDLKADGVSATFYLHACKLPGYSEFVEVIKPGGARGKA